MGKTIKEVWASLGRSETVPATAPDPYQVYPIPNSIPIQNHHNALFSRDEQEVIFTPYSTMVPQPEINYSDFGYIPNVAQQLGSDIGNPKILTPPWFDEKDLSHALWFTTRTILNPLGNAE